MQTCIRCRSVFSPRSQHRYWNNTLIRVGGWDTQFGTALEIVCGLEWRTKISKCVELKSWIWNGGPRVSVDVRSWAAALTGDMVLMVASIRSHSRAHNILWQHWLCHSNQPCVAVVFRYRIYRSYPSVSLHIRHRNCPLSSVIQKSWPGTSSQRPWTYLNEKPRTNPQCVIRCMSDS